MYSDVGSIPIEPRPAEIAQLLDEHHLAVVSGRPRRRARLVAALAERLRSIADAEVCVLHGARINDLMTFRNELERSGVRPDATRASLAPTIEGVIDALRSDGISARHQYFIWEDADNLLDTNVRLFGQLANALMGVAAEREHVSDETLVLQRAVFVGGDKLGAYAEDPCGQFRTWFFEDGTTPFWEVVSCVGRPAVLTYRLDG